MIRLLLLLLGTQVARRLWVLFLVAGLGLMGSGVSLVLDVLDGRVKFPLHTFGWTLFFVGLATLFTSAVSRGMQKRLRQLRALGLLLLALVLIDDERREDVILAVIFAVAYALDGAFRIASASVLRFPKWPRSMALGVAELLLAATFLDPYPSHYTGTVPYAMGVGLVIAGFFSVRAAFELWRLPPQTTLVNLLSRGYTPLIGAAGETSYRSGESGTVTVHVWTPTGSVKDAQRQFLVDRYVAARDPNGVISTGHAALEGPAGLYISHYPAVEMDRSPSDFALALRATPDRDVPAKFQPSYAEEAAGWCESTQKVRFDDVDVARLARFWENYRAENVYNLTRRNCSSTTALALETALEGWLTRRGAPVWSIFRVFLSPELWVAAQLRQRAESMAWTPGIVLDYARALYGALHPPDAWYARAVTARTMSNEAARRDDEALAAHDAALDAAPTPSTALREREQQQAAKRRSATAAVIATAAIFGLTYGLSAPLIAEDLAHAGKKEIFIGLNAAMHAVGVLAVAPLLPRLSRRFGARALMVVALMLSALLMAAFPIAPSLWLWFPLRLGLGVAAEILFVMSETWANDLSDEKTRGRVMAIYTAAMSLGFAGGPAILSVVPNHHVAYFIGAGVAALALLPILNPGILLPANSDEDAHDGPLHYARVAPIATATALLNAAVETAGLSFVALYAVGLGFSEASSLRLVSTLMIGAIVLQLPIGLLADKVDKKRLVTVLASIAAVGAFAWPWMLRDPNVAFAVVFVWGGLFVGVYTVMLAMVGSRFRGSELVGVYSMMSVGWGAGALVGPAVVGMAMTANPRLGLPWAIGAACAVYAVVTAMRRKRAV